MSFPLPISLPELVKAKPYYPRLWEYLSMFKFKIKVKRVYNSSHFITTRMHVEDDFEIRASQMEGDEVSGAQGSKKLQTSAISRRNLEIFSARPISRCASHPCQASMVC